MESTKCKMGIHRGFVGIVCGDRFKWNRIWDCLKLSIRKGCNELVLVCGSAST